MQSLLHQTHIQGCLLLLFCPGLRSIFSVVYFHVLSQENKITMIHSVIKYQEKLRIKSEGLNPTLNLCQIKLLPTHYFPLVNRENIILLELIYLIILNEMTFRGSDVCIDFGCGFLQSAEGRAFLESCVCLPMAGWGQGTLAGGTAIPNHPKPNLCCSLASTGLGTPLGRGLWGGHSQALLIPALTLPRVSSQLSQWDFQGGFSKHFRELSKCVAGKCHGFFAARSL